MEAFIPLPLLKLLVPLLVEPPRMLLFSLPLFAVDCNGVVTYKGAPEFPENKGGRPLDGGNILLKGVLNPGLDVSLFLPNGIGP